MKPMAVRRPRAAGWARCFQVLVAPWLFAVCACSTKKVEPAKSEKAPAVVAVPRSKAKPVLAHRSGPQAPLEQFVQQHVEEADASGVRVLVYVGASWCEPCRRFHRALEAGELDDSLAGTQFIEFDADRDAAELRAAGYVSKYIPLFSVPDPSGHSSGRAVEGSIKGDNAVRENLVPRLQALLDGKPTD
jgi:thiol-disulfide isomerase/thioredoxin